jgi:sigma-B regulation protein RsbU (phosphoserine phosphatase)
MLWSSTDPAHFATLFMGIYMDTTRYLSFVNCGHNAALHLRRDGSQERLAATATVIGAFEDWDCSLGATQLDAGDLLVVYSDGITDASRGDDQFGDERLVRIVRDHAHLPVDDIADAIIASVQEFEGGDQSDDLTLVVARAR